jgi:D-alanyl-lipoteichoic acid acyltransferase DltB (MBOAT superfamily)
MQFLSLIVLLLIAVAVPINALIGPRYRIWWLLVCNIIFVSLFFWPAMLAVLALSLFNFYTVKAGINNRAVFLLNLFVNITALVVANYVVGFGSRSPAMGIDLKLIGFSIAPVLLTLGLSFYTLQHIAYAIDCRKGRQEAEKDFCRFLFASTFFPKFLSGPLTRYDELNKQHGGFILKAEVIRGFNRLLLGIFKKMVIADRLAPGVHSVFDFPDEYSGLTVFTGALLFTVQLYFDFSGYSDMAIGTARMLGFTLPENFNLPFRSASVTEFWRRWHMSLIRFFTDYIFYPVSYAWRRHRYLSAAAGIALTFLVSGLWHGIGLPFLLWSLCHLVYLEAELATRRLRDRQSKVFRFLGGVCTILAVAFSNIFFRSTDTANLLQHWHSLAHHFLPEAYTAGLLAPLAVGGQQADFFNFWTTIVLAFAFLFMEKRINALSAKKEFSIVYVVGVLLLICLFGVFAGGEQFIYVQF